MKKAGLVEPKQPKVITLTVFLLIKAAPVDQWQYVEASRVTDINKDQN